MNVAVFNSNLSAQANVTLSPDEEALFLEIFSNLDKARKHPVVQQRLNIFQKQHQVYGLKPTLNGWTVFRMIWSYATMGRSDFHSLDTIYHAKKAYLTQTGVLAALVKEFNSCRRRLQSASGTPEMQQSESTIPLPLANAFDDSVATVTTMTTQFDTAPTAQYSVYASSEVPLTFTSDFSNIPFTSYSSDLSLNSYPPPVLYVPPDADFSGAWGGHYVPSLSPGMMYPNDNYYMQPASPNVYSGNQFTDVGPSQFALQHHHEGSAPLNQYQNDSGGSYGVQGDNQVHTRHDPRLEQNQGQDHYGDAYETFY